MYEGGVRIPFIVRWPGKVPVDTVNETSILSGLDFLPTLCHLAGTPYDKEQFEGMNVADIWLGQGRNPERFLFWAKQSPVGLDKNWKYHVNKQTGDELYDLANDPNETTNVIAQHPEKAASMHKSVMEWFTSLPAPPRKAPPPKPKSEKKAASTKPTVKADSTSYPWQNYSGPLQQNWFELHNGLKNSQYIFETTKKGTVAFVGGSITGMPCRRSWIRRPTVKANCLRRASPKN